MLASAVALTAHGLCELSQRQALGLGLVTALALLNRLDLALILAMPLALAVAVNRSRPCAVLAMVLPPLLIVGDWMIFAQVTYGSSLPNTFLAKTNVDIPQTELLVQGVRYLYVSLVHDPVTAIALLTALVLAVVAGTAPSRAWMSGIAMYLAYVIWIGGDFMAFRFLAVPAVVAVALITATPWHLTWAPLDQLAVGTRDLIVTSMALVTALGLLLLSWGRAEPALVAAPMEPQWAYHLQRQISGERGAYAPRLGLWSYVQALGDTDEATKRGSQGSRLVELSNAARAWPSASDEAKITDV